MVLIYDMVMFCFKFEGGEFKKVMLIYFSKEIRDTSQEKRTLALLESGAEAHVTFHPPKKNIKIPL